MKINKVRSGEYYYKNGITIKKLGKIWKIFYMNGNIAFEGDSLKSCKSFLYWKYNELCYAKYRNF